MLHRVDTVLHFYCWRRVQDTSTLVVVLLGTYTLSVILLPSPQIPTVISPNPFNGLLEDSSGSKACLSCSEGEVPSENLINNTDRRGKTHALKQKSR